MLGPQTDVRQHNLKHRENEKNCLKRGRFGLGGNSTQNDQKNRKFCNFQMGIEIVLDAQSNRQTRRWKAEVP